MKKKSLKIMRLLFVVVSVMTVLEYTFICGMFTGPLMMALMFLVGFVNAGLSLREKEYFTAYLCAIGTIALCMGYWKLMF